MISARSAPRVRRAACPGPGPGNGSADTFEYYAGLADTFPFEERARPTARRGVRAHRPGAGRGRRRDHPVERSHGLISYKIAPALLAGCTVVLKSSPEAPGEGYLVAEAAEAAGLPPGVLNVVTADREVSELLVRDPRVDKITFTGSTAAGRRIASLCGERIARCTLELGGKSAAVILEDIGHRDRGQGSGQRRVPPVGSGLLFSDSGRRHPPPS